MKITEISKVGKGLRYKVYADGEFAGIFEAEILARYQVKTGSEYSLGEFEEIKLANGDYACFDMALGALGHGMKTEKTLIESLQKKGYPDSSIEKAVEKVKEYGYLNDREYADSYIKTYASTKGRRKLKCELLNKGVPADIVAEALEAIDGDEQLESCRRLAEKYLRNKVKDDKLQQKLYRHLVSKGFDFSTAAQVLSEVKNDWD